MYPQLTEEDLIICKLRGITEYRYRTELLAQRIVDSKSTETSTEELRDLTEHLIDIDYLHLFIPL